MAIWKDAFLATSIPLSHGSQVLGLSNGNILVIGADIDGAYNESSGLIGSLFDAGGNPLIEPFWLGGDNSIWSSGVSSLQHIPLADGGFLVQTRPPDSDSPYIYTFYNADGTPRANTFPIEGPWYSEATQLANGNIVVSWSVDITIPFIADDIETLAQIYGPSGNLLVPEFRLGPIRSNNTENNQRIAALENGGFVLVASGDALNGSDRVEVSIFDDDGQQIGSSFKVQSSQSGAAEVAALSNGRFVVAYLVPPTSASMVASLRLKIYNEDGSSSSTFKTPPGIGVFSENLLLYGSERKFEIVALHDGHFAIRTASGAYTSVVTVFSASGTVIDTIADLNFTGAFDGTLGATADGRLLIKELTAVWYDGFPDWSATTTIHDYRPQGSVIEGTSEADQLTAPALGGTVNGRLGNDTIWGAGGDDTLYGNNGQDQLFGGGGSDILDGGNAVDTVNGDSGDDIVKDSDGANGEVLYGGIGIDTIDFRGTAIGFGATTIDLTLGRMTFSFTGLFDTIRYFENVEGSDRGEIAIESAGRNEIRLNGGNDRLVLSDATIDSDIFDGGSGTDTFDLSQLPPTSGQIRVDLGAGTWSRNGASETVLNFENIEGSGYDEILVGSNADNTIKGNVGNDIIRGGLGVDSLHGGTGNDSFEYSVNDIVVGEFVDGGSNTDTLQIVGIGSFRFDLVTFVSIETVSFYDFGTGERTARLNAAQFGTGISLKAVIDGNEGATDRDVLDIRMNGATSLDLSSLSFLQWTSGHDLIQILGGVLSETIVGSSVIDLIESGDGNDVITGGGGRDTLRGGNGSDTFLFKAGDAVAGEVIDGGLDRDAIELGRGGVHDFRSASIQSIEQITFGSGTSTTEAIFTAAQFQTGAISTLSGIQGGIGTGQDLLTINIADKSPLNLAGLDFSNWGPGGDSVRIFGSAADDVIIGSEVGDTISGGLGNDQMVGGLGNDTYVVNDAGDQAIENASEGVDTVLTSLVSLTLFNEVENLTFTGAGTFVAIGNRLDNVISGGSDNDLLRGVNGSDTLYGGDGDDELLGGGGHDVLIGGAGRDELSGGTGNDIFRLTDVTHSGVSTLRDVITDFEQGFDLVDLSAIASFTFVGEAGFGGGGNATVRFFQTEAIARTIVAGDADGDGQADFQLSFDGLFTLQASDFIL